jgi:hypothetical protein
MVQNNWKTFGDLRSALAGTRGRTLVALRLVTENMFAAEIATWIAPADVNIAMTWTDGVVVLTDQRLFFAECGDYNSFTVFIERGPSLRLQELQGSRGLVRFQVPNMGAQGVALPRAQFEYLKQALETDDGVDIHAGSSPVATESGDHVELLRQLGSLRDAGVLSPLEFAVKKAELLSRI